MEKRESVTQVLAHAAREQVQILSLEEITLPEAKRLAESGSVSVTHFIKWRPSQFRYPPEDAHGALMDIDAEDLRKQKRNRTMTTAVFVALVVIAGVVCTLLFL